MKKLIGAFPQRIDARFLIELQSICETKFSQFTEKRVDVSIAVDMVVKAHAQEYDAASILSADGDFVAAVLAVKALGKKVFAASQANGRELAKVVDAFIPLRKEWFHDLAIETN